MIIFTASSYIYNIPNNMGGRDLLRPRNCRVDTLRSYITRVHTAAAAASRSSTYHCCIGGVGLLRTGASFNVKLARRTQQFDNIWRSTSCSRRRASVITSKANLLARARALIVNRGHYYIIRYIVIYVAQQQHRSFRTASQAQASTAAQKKIYTMYKVADDEEESSYTHRYNARLVNSEAQRRQGCVGIYSSSSSSSRQVGWQLYTTTVREKCSALAPRPRTSKEQQQQITAMRRRPAAEERDMMTMISARRRSIVLYSFTIFALPSERALMRSPLARFFVACAAQNTFQYYIFFYVYIWKFGTGTRESAFARLARPLSTRYVTATTTSTDTVIFTKTNDYFKFLSDSVLCISARNDVEQGEPNSTRISENCRRRRVRSQFRDFKSFEDAL
ncbi:unnamed protein product [Trichogramma brassicae]|uniref:Uncharacterized protein n=1 Tax=Trichogramma brassicae TaxID=86971 RepID=A0A6H5IKU4_9HYME|nr:unnamed protein product [Trichogramma brassicae]